MISYDFEKLRVLVVDDSYYMIKIVSTLLEAMGVTQILGINAEGDVLATIQTFRPNLVIMDHVMEPVTGLQLIRQIRQRKHEQRYIPIILLTGCAHADVVKSARFHAGADAVLVKPVSMNRLFDCIVSIRESDRTFIRTHVFFGPDRRVKDRPFEGENKRDFAKKLKPAPYRNEVETRATLQPQAQPDSRPAPAAAEQMPVPAPEPEPEPEPEAEEDDDMDFFEIDVPDDEPADAVEAPRKIAGGGH